MPQMIALALLGAGLYAGYRWYTRTAKEFATQLKHAEDEVRRRSAGALEKDMGRLEYDPASGVYRPADRR